MQGNTEAFIGAVGGDHLIVLTTEYPHYIIATTSTAALIDSPQLPYVFLVLTRSKHFETLLKRSHAPLCASGRLA